MVQRKQDGRMASSAARGAEISGFTIRQPLLFQAERAMDGDQPVREKASRLDLG
jgi:hypothetical protein